MGFGSFLVGLVGLFGLELRTHGHLVRQGIRIPKLGFGEVGFIGIRGLMSSPSASLNYGVGG